MFAIKLRHTVYMHQIRPYKHSFSCCADVSADMNTILTFTDNAILMSLRLHVFIWFLPSKIVRCFSRQKCIPSIALLKLAKAKKKKQQLRFTQVCKNQQSEYSY